MFSAATTWPDLDTGDLYCSITVERRQKVDAVMKVYVEVGENKEKHYVMYNKEYNWL